MKILEMNPEGAETIVFLHGGNVAGWMWGEQVPAFPEYRILVPDLPGFGHSNHLAWVSTVDAADRIAAALDSPAHVVGLSLGSAVAVALAARHPALVRSLFLASTQAAPPLRRDRIAARFMLTLWNQRGFWTAQARGYGLTADDADLFIDTGLGIRRKTAQTVFDEVRHGIADDLLDAVRAPTLAVAGELDSKTVTLESLRRISQHVRGSRTALAPGLHHQFNIEDVALFNGALRTWLGHSARVGFQADNHHSPVHPNLKEIPPWL